MTTCIFLIKLFGTYINNVYLCMLIFGDRDGHNTNYLCNQNKLQ